MNDPDIKTPPYPLGFVWWCESCGTLTNDDQCDCTMYGNPQNQRLRFNTPDDETDR